MSIRDKRQLTKSFLWHKANRIRTNETQAVRRKGRVLPGEGAGGGVGTSHAGCVLTGDGAGCALREDGAGLGRKHRPQASGAGQGGGCPETHGASAGQLLGGARGEQP